MEYFKIWPWNLFPNKDLDPIVLAGPQMADEPALAARIAVRVTVGLAARELLDVLGEVVSDKGTKATLVGGFAGVVQAELDAFGMGTAIVGTCLPGIHDLVRLFVVLDNYKASIQV